MVNCCLRYKILNAASFHIVVCGIYLCAYLFKHHTQVHKAKVQKMPL